VSSENDAGVPSVAEGASSEVEPGNTIWERYGQILRDDKHVREQQNWGASELKINLRGYPNSERCCSP